ncbi:MAG: hypothetical protein EOP92_25440, partial [Lysobacteraceae bacterium]
MPARRPFLLAALLAAAVLTAPALARDRKKEADKPKDPNVHGFAVVGHRAADGGEDALKDVLHEAQDEDLAFLVVTGIKG